MKSKFSTSDYSSAMRSLLPRGRVWERGFDGSQSSVVDGLAITTQRSDDAAISLLKGSFPATADQLLPEWNESLGLPDSCCGYLSSTSSNQQQIVAKLTATGGQSIPYFTKIAADLGYSITITEFAMSTVRSLVSSPICGLPWAFAWQVNIKTEKTFTPSVIQPVNSAIGSGYPPNLQALFCILDRYAPAHTQLLYSYVS